MTVSLSTLDVELLIQILTYIDDTSPKTTKAVSLVNKHLNATSKFVVHRHKELVFVGPGLRSSLSEWSSNDLILHGIRRLSISGQKNYISAERDGPISTTDVNRIYSRGFDRLERRHEELADSVEKGWKDLAQLICQITNLRALTWNLSWPIPSVVLDALHVHQKKAELTVNRWCIARGSADHPDAAEITLANSPALTTIRAMIWPNVETLGVDIRLAALKRIVACAPNLRFASIVRGGETRNLPEDQAHRFYTHDQPNSALHHLTLDGWELSEQTLDEWGQIVDLSQLESVKCSRGLPDVSYFMKAPVLLPNLKHISLNLSTLVDDNVRIAAENYIATCAPLTSLSLWSWANNVTLSTILRHGPTLKTLQLHERETIPIEGRRIRYLLTLDDIKAIKSACAKLQDLTFDLHRTTSDLDSELETQQEIIKELSSWYSLAKLQIYYDLYVAILTESYGGQLSSSDGTGPFYPKPSSNEAIEIYLPELWKAVYGGRPTGARALDVKFGEWEEKFIGEHPRAAARTYWVVRPCERDDQANKCTVIRHGIGLTASVAGVEAL